MGGIVGYNSGKILKCSNSATINCWGTDSTYDTLKGSGGIAGVSVGLDDAEGKISDCYNTGRINGHYNAGGITGWIQNTTIENCYNTGNIKVFKEVQNNYVEQGARYSYKYAGGIAGFIWSGHIDNCYNSGDVYSIEQGGGIFGGDYYQAGGSVSNCYTVGKIEGLSYIGDVFGWSGGVTLTDNKYFEPTEENYTTIASLLNSNVTSENGYFGWKNDKDKFSFTKVYEVSFGIIPSDAKLVEN